MCAANVWPHSRCSQRAGLCPGVMVWSSRPEVFFKAVSTDLASCSNHETRCRVRWRWYGTRGVTSYSKRSAQTLHRPAIIKPGVVHKRLTEQIRSVRVLFKAASADLASSSNHKTRCSAQEAHRTKQEFEESWTMSLSTRPNIAAVLPPRPEPFKQQPAQMGRLRRRRGRAATHRSILSKISRMTKSSRRPSSVLMRFRVEAAEPRSRSLLPTSSPVGCIGGANVSCELAGADAAADDDEVAMASSSGILKLKR